MEYNKIILAFGALKDDSSEALFVPKGLDKLLRQEVNVI